MLPTTCEMPDLSDLENLLIGFTASLFGDGNVDQRITDKEQRYYRMLIRLVHKAHANYQSARRSVLASLGNKRRIRSIVIDFVDYMENCLNAINRLYGVLDRAHGEKGEGLTIDRAQFKAITQYSKLSKKLRNAIEHLDEHIQKGEWTGAVCLTISNDNKRVGIGGHWISFDELALAIRKFHEIGRTWRKDFINPV
jgi:hypothetical protein